MKWITFLAVFLLVGCAKEIARDEIGRFEDVEPVSCTYSCFRMDCGMHYQYLGKDGGHYAYSCMPDYTCNGHRDAKHLHIHYMVFYDDETKKVDYTTQTLAFLSECK